MSGGRHYDQDKDSTNYVGNLDERATDSLVWELFVNMGHVVNVHLPKDRVTQLHQGYGFVEMGTEGEAEYSAKVLNGIRVYGKPIRVNKASADRRGTGNEAGGTGGPIGIGADLFVGNLDPLVDEKTLFDTFSRFGPFFSAPKVARDDAHLSKGYAFISYADFEASDDAIANMNGQYLANKECTVQYAYKKDGKGERHGDEAERALASEAKKNNVTLNLPVMPAALTGAPVGPAAMNGGGYQRPMGTNGGGYPSNNFPTAYPNNAYPANYPSNFPTGGYPAGGYAAPGYPNNAYGAGGYPATNYPTNGYSTAGYPATAYPTAGYTPSPQPPFAYNGMPPPQQQQQFGFSAPAPAMPPPQNQQSGRHPAGNPRAPTSK